MESQIEEYPGGWLVTIQTDGGQGKAKLLYRGLEQPKRHQLEAELTVWEEVAGKGSDPDPFTAHLNILSLSSRESYRRHLDEQYGKGGWTNILNRGCALVRQAWESKDWSIDLDGVETDMNTSYLVKPFVLDCLPAVWFGPGNTGKTYLALALAKAIVTGDEFLGSPCTQGPVLIADYETTERDIKRRLLKLGLGDFSNIIYWPGRGRPLSESIRPLGQIVERRQVRLIIVDSAVLACGDDPKEERVAAAYFNALAQIGVASLTISHMTKDEKDDVHPYGSIYWYSTARLVWNIKASDMSDDERHVGLFCRKSNEDRRPPAVGAVIDFTDDIVTVYREQMALDLMAHLSLQQRIRDLLRRRAYSLHDLAVVLDAKEDSIGKTLRRMPDATRIDSGGRGETGTWGLKAEV